MARDSTPVQRQTLCASLAIVDRLLGFRVSVCGRSIFQSFNEGLMEGTVGFELLHKLIGLSVEGVEELSNGVIVKKTCSRNPHNLQARCRRIPIQLLLFHS